MLETPQGLQLAGSLVPRGEDAQALLREITPALMDVRRTRAVSLTHGPEGANELDQRSRVIAPLIAQRQLLGYLYADLDGAFGRLRESDRDLLGMLASQAAVALDNAQWSQGLEQKVEERTSELTASNANLEQRNAELAIINSIQQGLAAELDFQAIVDLVGDKLREVFNTPDLGIRWYDEKANLLHYLYAYEHGKRLTHRTATTESGRHVRDDHAVRASLASSIPPQTMKDTGQVAVPGTDQSKSLISVPIISSDRVLGMIDIENYERENAYGESELRLLTTIAASLGTALENARLFDETQRLLKETEQRAAELAVINRIQEGHGRRARLPGDRRSGRRQAARSVPLPGTLASPGTTPRPICSAGYTHTNTACASTRRHRPRLLPAARGKRWSEHASRSFSTHAPSRTRPA